MYSPQLLDHFEHPRNVGEIADADARAEVENPACGDIMLLTLKVADGRILDARYRTRGCVASIACGSLLTEWLRGKSLVEARSLRREQIVEGIGGLSSESTHASHLVVDALRAALATIR
jgi:nitrogen fixation NifU-like protein